MLKDLIENETNEYAKKFYHHILERGYDLIGNSKYVKARDKVNLRCPKGHEIKMAPFVFNKGHNCRICARKEVAEREIKEYAEKFYRMLEHEGYELIDNSNYKNSQTQVKIKHKKCGHIYQVFPNLFFKGTRCPRCAGNIKKTQEKFEKELIDLVGDEYTVLSEYKNTNEYVKFKHNSDKCNHFIFKMRANSFLITGNRCPRCTRVISKGEEKIERFLSDSGYKYEAQKRFENCRNKYTLPFDFAVYENDRIICLIEFQGTQHFEPVVFFGGEQGFKRTKINDFIKKEFCNENDIPLLEIAYQEIDNIEEILDKELNNLINKAKAIS